MLLHGTIYRSNAPRAMRSGPGVCHGHRSRGGGNIRRDGSDDLGDVLGTYVRRM